MTCIKSIAPLLSVRRGAQAVEFYKNAFGAREIHRVDAPTGEVVARLAVDGAEFWVSDESPEHKNFSPESTGGVTARMVMIADDPQVVFDRAVGAGATIVWTVAERYGWLLGMVSDPFGHRWEIGKPLPAKS